MEIEYIPVEKLNLDPANVRDHPEKNLKVIKSSLARFGQQKPIVVDKNNVIIAGNGTFMAACNLGWTEIQCVRSELVGTEQTAFAIADNRTSELAEWNKDALASQLESLKIEDFELEDIGFEDFQLDDDKGSSSNTKSEEVEPEVEMSEELDFKKDYLVITFDDKDKLKAFNEMIGNDKTVGFNLTKNADENKSHYRQGPNRIVNGDNMLQRLINEK